MDPSLLDRHVQDVARDLLGCRLLSFADGRKTEGRIVEVEAYGGSDDLASHATARVGRTPRNQAMFGPAGTAYVYFVYGMHWCFNIVTGKPGEARAVLVRAIEPTFGREEMVRRRGRDRDIANGPARICEALGIDGTLDGHRLSGPPLWLLAGDLHPGEEIGASGRIGIRRAQDLPWRFFVVGHPDVSPVRPANAGTRKLRGGGTG